MKRWISDLGSDIAGAVLRVLMVIGLWSLLAAMALISFAMVVAAAVCRLFGQPCAWVRLHARDGRW